MTRRLVLVTGGAGFIGSNITARLAEDPALDVVVCDRLGTAALGKWRNIAKHPIADLITPEAMPGWLDRNVGDLALVAHMGGVSSTLEPDADRIIEANFTLSRVLFDWCAAHRRRLIYASSAATYGDGALGFDDRDGPERLAGPRPLSAYAWSKALFDRYAARQAARGLAPPQWVGLKFFNVYGPNEAHKGAMMSVAGQIWPDIAAGRAARLFRSYRPGVPDGGQARDFTYVRDVAEVVAWLLNAEAVSGVFNLGSGKARTFEALARAMFAAARLPPRIEYVDMPEAIREHYQYFTEARMEKLVAAGYGRAMTSLEDGIADYVRGYLSQADPYR